MKSFDSKSYSVNDFREWNVRGQLELQPRFQRRDVWTGKARSFLMDTIVRGKPMPKVFIRQRTDPNTKQTIREVVDGQQRLTTILRFLEDDFVIAKLHNENLGNVVFSEMEEDVQRQILDYSIAVDVLLGVDDQDILDIFARINSYAVTLNQQEQLNAKYFGEFKQAVYELSIEYFSLWRSLPFLTDQRILRMGEAELVSDLLIAMSDGIRAKKAIPRYYDRFDDDFPNMEHRMDRFRRTIDMGAELMVGHQESNFLRRVHLFYTYITSLYHLQFGIQNVNARQLAIKRNDFVKVRSALEAIDAIFDKAEESLNSREREFLTDSRRATTDEAVRIRRTTYTCDLIAATLRSSVL